MKLSPSTQYHLRKLLQQKQSIARGKLTTQAEEPVGCDTDLNRILTDIYPVEENLFSAIQELEALNHHHQRLEVKKTALLEELAQVEKKIFRLLGLNDGSTSFSETLTIIEEAEANLFRFFCSNGVSEGLRYGTELYGLVCEFKLEKAKQAHQLTCSLLTQGASVVVSESKSRCAVWINLRSPSYQLFVYEDRAPFFRKTLLLYASLSRLKPKVTASLK